MPRWLVSAALLCCLHGAACDSSRMEEVLSWRALDFQYPSAAARYAALMTGQFVPENCNPADVDVWRDKVFVTVPRWRNGVPSTVNYVQYVEGGEKSPVLIPYPDLETNTLPGPGEEAPPPGGELPHKIISSFRVRVDACDRLWVVDSGYSDRNGASNYLGPPKILVYDLKTDQLLRQHAVKPSDIKPNSLFVNVVVDTTPETCDDAFAYVVDVLGFGVVVYSFRSDSSWRARHHFFHLDPVSGDMNVAGVNFQWAAGILGIALSPRQHDGYRTLYFHAVASTREFKVSTSILQNQTTAVSDHHYHEFKNLGSRGPNTHSTTSDLDERSGVLFYTQLTRNGLGCWNSVTHADEYSPSTNALPVFDNVTMISPISLKVDRQSNVWLLSNRQPLFENDSLDFNDINYRIFRGRAGDIIRNTVCDPGSRGHQHPLFYNDDAPSAQIHTPTIYDKPAGPPYHIPTYLYPASPRSRAFRPFSVHSPQYSVHTQFVHSPRYY